MKSQGFNKPDFLIIGAQKAGTTWLWEKLNLHPGTSLPKEKEIHFFGGVENYQRGADWYYNHFSDLNPDKITGEASTTYLYDRIPYWYNKSDQLEVDTSLPTIPELITRELPDIKIIVLLRDPVWRAVSAYKHWMRKGNISPFLGLKETALRYPKIRIIECGHYGRYLKLWREYVPNEKMLILVFEEDIVKHPEDTLKKLFRFLNLDTGLKLDDVEKPVHKSWTWNRTILEYYAAPVLSLLSEKNKNRLASSLAFLKLSAFNKEDIEFLRSRYISGRTGLAKLIGRELVCWDYGNSYK